LLNDPVYVEAAGALAARTLREQPDGDVAARISYMVRLCLGRQPSALEQDALRRLYEQQVQDARRDPKAAHALVGAVALPPGATRPQLAAWYAVSTTLLNLDEAITKE
jgi:hypothetical protein